MFAVHTACGRVRFAAANHRHDRLANRHFRSNQSIRSINRRNGIGNDRCERAEQEKAASAELVRRTPLGGLCLLRFKAVAETPCGGCCAVDDPVVC